MDKMSLGDVLGTGGPMPPEPDDDEYGPPMEFDDAIAVALPDLDEEKRMALWDAIAACVDQKMGSG
jgi:hypothetical protein